jgi:hypothetical protein
LLCMEAANHLFFRIAYLTISRPVIGQGGGRSSSILLNACFSL